MIRDASSGQIGEWYREANLGGVFLTIETARVLRELLDLLKSPSDL